MLGDIKDVLANLNSPSDWAIVGAAGLLGFTLDAAINIVPLPIFSPGVCGATAAGAALPAKRGWDADQLRKRNRRLLDLYRQEARHIAEELDARGLTFEARSLLFDAEVAAAEGDIAAIRSAFEKARARL